jgi:aspartate/methionine/tyrosine aminotransferase
MPIEVESPEEKGYSSIKNNLAESSVSDLTYKLKGNITLQYGPHRGDEALRHEINSNYYQDHHQHILVTPGAAAALYIAHTALLKPGDEMVVMHPNYATNLETPYAIGCRIKTLTIRFNEGYALTLKKVIDAISSKTKMVSLTNPNNPTGTVYEKELLDDIIDYCRSKKIAVLLDETYSNIPFPGYHHQVVNPSSNLIRVGSLSKAFGAPGIRIGWIHCSNTQWVNQFLAAKEQIIICNSVVDEHLALQILQQKKHHLSAIEKHITQNYHYLQQWIVQQNVLEYVMPRAGVVMLARLKSGIDASLFHDELLNTFGTLTGRGKWFGLPDRYFRIGFGWPSKKEWIAGLNAINKTALALAKS